MSVDRYDDADFEDTPEGEWPGKRRRAIDGPDRALYRTLRAKFREECAAKRAPCHICREPIDYALKHGDPRAWELDHDDPVVKVPARALDPTNFLPAHSVCNKRRALAEEEDDALGPGSEDWNAL